MSRARLKLSALVLAASVLGTACGGGGDGETAPTTVPEYDVEEGVGSSAADLRTDLTTLLQEHALLVGLASATSIGGGDAAPVTAVLDQNSVAIGDLITRLYGAPAGPAFLDAWQRHAAGLLAFAAVAPGGDKAAMDKARDDLLPIQEEIAATLNTANPQLTKEGVGEALDGYARGLQTAITAQAKNDEAAPSKLKEAVDEMAAPAMVLTAGIVKFRPDDFKGAYDGIGAAMRAELSSKLQEHAYLAGLAGATVAAGASSEGVTDAMEENSLELSRAFGTVYGDDAQDEFLGLWRQHIDLVLDFAAAARANDAAGMTRARADLDAYRSAFGAFLSGANPNFAARDVERSVGVHVDSLLAAVTAEVAQDPARIAKLKEAAGHMPETGLYLATGIARQFPAKFG